MADFIALSPKEIAYLKAGGMTDSVHNIEQEQVMTLFSPGYEDKAQIVRVVVHKWDDTDGLELHVYLPNNTTIHASVTAIDTPKKRPSRLQIRDLATCDPAFAAEGHEEGSERVA
jgi:hypothetical protein